MDFVDRQVLFKYLKNERLPYIRLMVLRIIQSTITNKEFLELKPWLLKDKTSSVRALALEMLYKFAPLDSRNELEMAASDVSMGVRETARFLLKKLGEYDFRNFYLKALQETEISVGSIAGLGEVGKAYDAKIIENHLNSENTRWVKASMHAVAKLDFPNFKEKLLTFLLDFRPGITKEARILLRNGMNKQDVEKVYRIYLESTMPHIKKNCAILLTALGKWDSLPYILELCASLDEEISKIGNIALEKWIMRYNRSFVSPTGEQVTAVKEALNKYRSTINENECDFIEFNLRAF